MNNLTYGIGQPDDVGFWQRMANAFKTAWATWNSDSTNHVENLLWGDFNLRLTRYSLYQHLYYNSVFAKTNAYAKAYRVDKELYRHVESLYNPIFRFVDMHVNYIFSGNLNTTDPTQGAIPIVADDALLLPVGKLWLDSKMVSLKAQYVRLGTMQGDVGLKVSEDREAGTVKIEVLPASQIAYVHYNSQGKIDHAIIGQRRRETYTGLEYVYAEEITPETIRTYRDGIPFAFNEDEDGALRTEWDNPYGFVPLVIAQHIDIGEQWGDVAFSGVIQKINRANDAATIALDNIRRINRSPKGLTGVTKANDLKMNQDREDFPFVSLPKDTAVHTLVDQVDLMGTLEHIRSILAEVEKDLPVLELAKIAALSQPPSGTALRTMFKHSVSPLEQAEQNYGEKLVEAVGMALYIGSQNRFEGYRGLVNTPIVDLTPTIRSEPIFKDELTLAEQINYLIQLGAPPDVPLRMISEYDDTELARILNYIQDQQRMNLAALGAGLDATTIAAIEANTRTSGES